MPSVFGPASGRGVARHPRRDLALLRKPMVIGTDALSAGSAVSVVGVERDKSLVPADAIVSGIQLLDGNEFVVNLSIWTFPLFQLRATLVAVDVALNATIQLRGNFLKRKAIETALATLPQVRRGVGDSLIIAAGEFALLARYRHVWKCMSYLSVRIRNGALECDFTAMI